MVDAAEKSPQSAPRSRTHYVERRARARVPLVVAGTLAHDGHMYDVLTVDVGIGGACIEIAARLPYGAHVELVLALPRAPGMRLPGVVRWTTERGLGMQFSELGAQETHAIAQLLSL